MRPTSSDFTLLIFDIPCLCSRQRIHTWRRTRSALFATLFGRPSTPELYVGTHLPMHAFGWLAHGMNWMFVPLQQGPQSDSKDNNSAIIVHFTEPAGTTVVIDTFVSCIVPRACRLNGSFCLRCISRASQLLQAQASAGWPHQAQHILALRQRMCRVPLAFSPSDCCLWVLPDSLSQPGSCFLRTPLDMRCQ